MASLHCAEYGGRDSRCPSCRACLVCGEHTKQCPTRVTTLPGQLGMFDREDR